MFFQKFLSFDNFFLWFTYRLSKIIYVSQFAWQKALIGLKKVRSKNKQFTYGLQIYVFSGLLMGWWSKLRAARQYPTHIWVPPPRGDGTHAWSLSYGKLHRHRIIKQQQPRGQTTEGQWNNQRTLWSVLRARSSNWWRCNLLAWKEHTGSVTVSNSPVTK